MKKLFFAFIAIGAILAFSACSSDDEKEQKFFTGDCKQSISLESGPANAPITSVLVSSSLADMLKDSPNFGSPIATGEFLVAGSNTQIKVTGLPEGVALKDFKININGIEQGFGEVSNEKANLNLYTSAYEDFFKRTFNQMVKNGKLETKASFTPTEKTTEDVKLEITFSGRFSYWVRL